MKSLAIALSLVSTVAFSKPFEIPEEVVNQCKKDGCIILLPEEMVIPKPLVKETIQADMHRAYQQGLKDGAATCKRKDI